MMPSEKQRRTETMKKTLGMMISSKRKEKGMTQLELADLMGVSDKAVSKWERDLSCPDVNSLPKLAEIFEMSVDELMQIKTGVKQEEKKDISETIELICKALSLAMGVGVVALSILGELDTQTGFTMLGVGLASISLYLLQEKDSE